MSNNSAPAGDGSFSCGCDPASQNEWDRMPGHIILARMGKKVLRPGGLELTRKLLDAAKVTSSDRVVEFGPGVGKTAEILLAANPQEYTGVDHNLDCRKEILAVLEGHRNAQIITKDAGDTGLDDACADLVVGEAMLTMCSPKQKAAIIEEAFRLLAPGGRYAIHELGLKENVKVDKAQRSAAAKDISSTVKIAARPLPMSVWRQLFEDAGFEVEWQGTAPMHLLRPARMIADEGFFGFIKLVSRIATTPPARRRIIAIRKTFERQKDDLLAVGFVLRKP